MPRIICLTSHASCYVALLASAMRPKEFPADVDDSAATPSADDCRVLEPDVEGLGGFRRDTPAHSLDSRRHWRAIRHASRMRL